MTKDDKGSGLLSRVAPPTASQLARLNQIREGALTRRVSGDGRKTHYFMEGYTRPTWNTVLELELAGWIYWQPAGRYEKCVVTATAPQ